MQPSWSMLQIIVPASGSWVEIQGPFFVSHISRETRRSFGLLILGQRLDIRTFPCGHMFGTRASVRI